MGTQPEERRTDWRRLTPGQLARQVDMHQRFLRGDAHGERADLSHADLGELDLTAIDLRHARLAGARFAYGRLGQARLTGADLTGADLRMARLDGADLTGADLRGACLRGADLADAVLVDADLREAAIVRGDASGPATRLPPAPTELTRATMHRARVMNARLARDRKSTRLNSSHHTTSRMPSSA